VYGSLLGMKDGPSMVGMRFAKLRYEFGSLFFH